MTALVQLEWRSLRYFDVGMLRVLAYVRRDKCYRQGHTGGTEACRTPLTATSLPHTAKLPGECRGFSFRFCYFYSSPNLFSFMLLSSHSLFMNIFSSSSYSFNCPFSFHFFSSGRDMLELESTHSPMFFLYFFNLIFLNRTHRHHHHFPQSQ